MNLNRLFQISIIAAIFIGALLFFKSLLIPLAYAVFISFVLYPIMMRLIRLGTPEFLAILIPILLTGAVFFMLVMLLSYELSMLDERWAQLQISAIPWLHDLQHQLEDRFNWSIDAQFDWLRRAVEKYSTNAGEILKDIIHASSTMLIYLVIIPIYTYLILAYRKKLVRFIISFFPASRRDEAGVALYETIHMFTAFIKGMVMVYLIVGILNSLGLLLLGVSNPFFYGILTAVMTIIPYLGIIVSSLLPISISWISSGSMVQPVGIVVVFAIVQYLEANLIFPYVVGKQINLNTLVSLIAIFAGGIIWGVSGMILILPLVAIFRIFASHFEGLNNWSEFLS